MENRPHVVLVGRNAPSDIEDRFLKWYDEVYCPVYIKMPGYTGIDRYQIVKKSVEYPRSVAIHQYKNRNAIEELRKNPIRVDMQKSHDATFYGVEWVWHDVYALIGSFKNDPSPREATIVENAPVIQIEGYRVPSAEQGRYDQWFMRWASRVCIPVLMKSPGLKAINCFKLLDLSMRWPGRTYSQGEIPSYVSILYFENLESLENCEGSPECASFKRIMELEFPGSLNTIWNVQYELRKSWRK